MQIAVVRLREAGQIMSYRSKEEVQVNDYVIVEADRGVEYGMVMDVKDKDISERENKGGLFKNIVRRVNDEDKERIERNQKESKEAMRMCLRKIREYKLDMKLVEAEYSFDRKKIVFYFTSEGRIDFRELVKDLAKVFKRRIEMRQIGVRDEARMFGGVGPCGETLCCIRFLKNFEPVSMKMAKTQKLPLTSGKISGICGRLMCCLSYEYKTYKECSKGLPKEGQMVDTPAGKGKVIAVNVLKRVAHVSLEDGRIEKLDFNCPHKKTDDKKNNTKDKDSESDE
ncbi:MAG: stage 0 sporulation family protein [Candidatus Omnitrophica bacterium]|nr:stage 0 sporulation family protein [Candidatus Omnitrophota bacterium]MDD5081127.1 stage 0 sporulation family protein [Candidatus Omnitrophota bacterium]MDD5441595.1 stage 0 sporulation family protein [Candidatus Omnitrophota bacterium]